MSMNKGFLCVLATCALFASCVNSSEAPVDEFQPTSEFAPAYNALVKADQDQGFRYQLTGQGKFEKVQCENAKQNETYYDIEQTVQVLNGLEIAQMKSADFYSFLEYMAKLDYTMVPDEVISAKMQLLPILQEMFLLEKENEQLQGLTAIMSSLGTGVYTMVKEYNVAETVDGVLNVVAGLTSPIPLPIQGNPVGADLQKVLNAQPIQDAKTAAFDCYEQKRALSVENSMKIAGLKAKYLEYLEHFTPIYMKYMKEWDRLSLEKDKAYLAIWGGRSADGYSIAQDILDKYPANRESMLLKSLACINLAKSEVLNSSNDETVLTIENESNTSTQKYKFSVEAQSTLSNYVDLYPSKAAPALVLLGQLELLNGNNERAMSYFDQAAIEYPKQAEELKEMLNSYTLRDYLNATPEGQYLMRLYRSTMEGYGWFSPNFHKAMYWDSMGEEEKSSIEIYNHFFRRGNQGLYDCLLTDMEFCEKNIYRSFKSQFMESSVLNVSVEEATHVFGKNGIKCLLTNNADLNLENVRLYICLHMKDMYVDEYEVVPCETINILAPGAVNTWLIDGYNIQDIVRVRAILMTDDRVCWVDDVNFKQSYARKNFYGVKGKAPRSLEMFADYNLSEAKLLETLKSTISGRAVNTQKGLLKKVVGSKEDKCLRIELPRAICLLDPVYSLGEIANNNTPSTQVLAGSVVRLEFKVEPDKPYEPLYVYSSFVNLKVDYELTDAGEVSVTSIEQI